MNLKINGKTWIEDLKKYGIVYLDLPKDFFDILKVKDFNYLICSRCSKTKGKNTGDKIVPKNLYISSQNIRFYQWCENNRFEYGILSDLYGLFMYNEKKEFYDVHPSSLSEDDFITLSEKIKGQMISRGFDTFIYYNSSPLMSIPYFKMMILTGFKIFYITKLFKKRRSILNEGI